jgi:hypothetical protein
MVGCNGLKGTCQLIFKFLKEMKGFAEALNGLKLRRKEKHNGLQLLRLLFPFKVLLSPFLHRA